MHAFLHKATASTTEVRGWFAVDSDDLFDGEAHGEATVEVADFDFTNDLMAAAARHWIRERETSTLRFDLTDAIDSRFGSTIRGRLTVGDATRDISADARVRRSDAEVVIEGNWRLSQREFGLTAPLGIKDSIDIEFRLVAHRTDE